MSKYIGIDVSKQTFDVSFLQQNERIYKSFKNNATGFKKLLKIVELDDWVVMEATGSYFFPLAEYLYSQSVQVVVENPLVIKRYSQSKLKRAKTDKADAALISEYAEVYHQSLKLWKPDSKVIINLRQLYTRIELLQKQINQTKNQLEAFVVSGSLTAELKHEIKQSIKWLRQQKEKFEKQLQQTVRKHFSDTMDSLTSIPGIGPKTAAMLTVVTDDFKKFDHYKQLIAYVGLSPRVYQSGTSVHGKGHICKMGKPQVRKLLYLCSWSAKRCNKKCIEMYDRLKAKNKPERVIKIAIANKLLKQAFAIATKTDKYQLDYA